MPYLFDKETKKTIWRKPIDAKEILRTSGKRYEAQPDDAVKKPTAPIGDLRRMRIEKAIMVLDPDSEFTGGGLPKVDAIEAVVGFDISAEERDAAWTAVQDEMRISGQTQE